MRPGFDPTRRNRNIGTAKQGHGADNEFRIPESWHQDRIFYERLEEPVIVKRQVWSKEIAFLIEAPRRGCFHYCTVDDIVTVLELLPFEDTRALRSIVLRQPKRKEERLASVWGRVVYMAELGKYEGLAIYLEALPLGETLRRPLSQDPPGLEEIEALRQDGHTVKRTKRHFEITSTPAACRNTQLFRTLPHEVGHWADYRQNLQQGIDHWQRPSREREQFAHAYAARFQESKGKTGAIPFPPKRNEARMRDEGLDPSWFNSGTSHEQP